MQSEHRFLFSFPQHPATYNHRICPEFDSRYAKFSPSSRLESYARSNTVVSTITMQHIKVWKAGCFQPTRYSFQHYSLTALRLLYDIQDLGVWYSVLVICWVIGKSGQCDYRLLLFFFLFMGFRFICIPVF